jgi:hypothetical protein
MEWYTGPKHRWIMGRLSKARKSSLPLPDPTTPFFESITKGFATALFLFDNAPSHQKQAPDALSACKMVKNPSPNWTHHKDGPQMQLHLFCKSEGPLSFILLSAVPN